MRRGLGGFNEQALSNTAWAFAVADPSSADELFGTASFTTRCAHLESSFPDNALTQLHQWSLWREERGAQWPGLPESLREACRDVFTTSEETSSRMQSDVVREIRLRGVQVEEEHRCETSGYSIDALVTLNNGEQVAVEVDGPSHFVGRSKQPTGPTLLKHRLLRRFGWRLESVPYWEWGRSQELPHSLAQLLLSGHVAAPKRRRVRTSPTVADMRAELCTLGFPEEANDAKGVKAVRVALQLAEQKVGSSASYSSLQSERICCG